MANFGVLWAEVKKGIGDRSDLDTEIKAALNDAVLDLILQFRIRQAVEQEIIVTSDLVYEYPLNPNCMDVITVRNDTDAVLLDKGDYTSFASIDFADADSTGTPSLWFVDMDSLFLYNSTPDDTGFEITYRYVKRFPPMAADADTFPIPREWERPAKLWAKSYVLELLGQSEKAMAAYAQGTAVAASRKREGAWGELLRGDNRIDMGLNYDQEGY
jgi:hypothetical protein